MLPVRSLARTSTVTVRAFTVSAAAMTNVNASGLTPEQSRKLPTRQPKQDEEGILKAMKELYSCKAQDSSYAHYREDAVFHDPVGIAEGIKHIREQFNGLSSLFAKATIDKFNVLENPPSVPANKILVDQDVSYYRKEEASGSPLKTVNSLLTIERDSQGKIVRHNEDWDHTQTSDSSEGFFGMLNEWRKKGTVKATSTFLKS